MGTTSGAGTAYPSGAPEFTWFLVGSIISNFCSTRGNFRDINVRVIVFKDHLNSISVISWR
jgi:hypothetical protein